MIENLSNLVNAIKLRFVKSNTVGELRECERNLSALKGKFDL